ncbi:hypothetical protein CJF42_13620 [Pseudoalteromonas sp. NBT06-2]|uniref:BamA/TamA family outer membrane protein n=1 Tax=Pseudoalteromonas sp. NBT06-2 TaxID=2025950 RepID=UPI000BA69644|nr:BamA/TamA family outer membrane protein [Pseudoalteromonas sp. NBT06-2]PAJ73872.1 hypothetical protein CJF42_13620 [Pseudoalteromonas sp. NBT06-2]
MPLELLNSCKSNTPKDDRSNTNQHSLLDNPHILPKALPGLKIGEITLKRLDIFDTSDSNEDIALFRLANKLHLSTKEEVIRAQLLFTSGESYSPEILLESERLLRNTSYLYDARITAKINCHNTIDISIITKELWTLLPEINFSRSGGKNKSKIGFRDSNLFGLGKRISISKTSNVDRDGYLFIYDDPNILNSRYRSHIEYSDNSDGEHYYYDINYPFFALNTPYSYGAITSSNKRTEQIYNRGKVISEFSQNTKISKFHFGLSSREKTWIRRVSFGYQIEKHKFSKLINSTMPIPEGRNLNYPFLSMRWFEDNYIKINNFDSISRTEDLNLGWDFSAKLGYTNNNLSNDDNRLIYQASVDKAHFQSKDLLWRFNAGFYGYWNFKHDDIENALLSTSTQLHYNTNVSHSWYAKLKVQYSKNLTLDNQLTLGGDTGLRGYPIHYQSGEQSFLFNLEKRYYWEYNFLQLFSVGAAAFFDIGRAWNSNKDNGINGDILKDIGIGLRLAPSKANSKTVIHIDLSIPLDKSQDVESAQWLITVKNTF